MLKIKKNINALNKINCIKKYFIFFLFIILLFSSSNNVNAITLDKTTYTLDEFGSVPIITVAPATGGLLFLYKTGEALPLFSFDTYEEGFDINYNRITEGSYSLIELYLGIGENWFCNVPDQELSYNDCKGLEAYMNEFTFTVVDPRPHYTTNEDGEMVLDSELAPAGHSVTSYSPEVNIFSIFKGSLFSDNLMVDYRVTDQNDSGNEKSSQGLRENPVSIFYSDKITNWYDNFLGSDNKTEIAKDQSKEGKYKWSVKDLIPGVLYKVIVEAIDLAGMWGQGISEYFSVDFTLPVFTVKVNPTAVRSGEVSISVDSSEDLSKIPEVKVTQNEGEAKLVVMKGEKSHYEGVYTVVSGFDGTAKIEVKGIDIAGNIGNVLVSGGTFSVGMNPPPKPKIDNFKEKIVTNQDAIDISGTTRVDTEVILSLNGVEFSKIKPNEKGIFSFTKIGLDKKKNKGINYVNVFSKDPLGSMSEGVLIEVKYNIPPTVKIVKPAVKDVLSNISSISVEGKDENSDTLFYKYQIISQSDFNNKINSWITLSDNNPSSTFPWNTTEVEDGSYVVRVMGTDGEVEVTSETVQIVVKNVLPYFRFENGRSTITNQSSISIKGKALTSINVTPRPSIVSVAYSMDGGSTWAPVKITNDGGSYQKKFSVEFTDLKEGTYPILWRTKDSRGFIGKIVHSLVVDKTAPKAPVVTSPKQANEIIIDDSKDENINKSGIQINIKGTTEAVSTVTLIYNDKTIVTKSLPTGAFTFADVTFEQKGKYDFKILATDQALNKSVPVTFSVIYNNLPTITFLNPKPFRGLSGNANISWSIKDIDGDSISNVVVSYRNKNTDTIFKNLVTSGLANGSYNWNTGSLAESNNYELKISANDSYSSTSQVETFSIDRTSPVLTSFIFDKNQIDKGNKKVSFVCSGGMTDNLSGVEFIEYKIEGEDRKTSPWYKGIITDGFLKNKASFSIKHPVLSLDGDYKVYARAVDASGNVSEPLSLSLSVDKSSPRVGGFFVGKSGVDILPDEEGKISIYKNSIFSFNISLEEDTENASLKIGGETFKLKKDLKSQLWIAEISLSNESTERLLIDAEDNAGNKIDNKDIGSVTSLNRGNISIVNKDKTRELIAGALVRVLKLNKSTNQYDDYTGSNSEFDSIISNQSGEYDLVLPQGEYKFIITEPNIKTLKYKYSISRPTIINLNFEVAPVSGLVKLINNFLEIFK